MEKILGKSALRGTGKGTVVYAFVFLFIAARGPGIWGLGGKSKKS